MFQMIAHPNSRRLVSGLAILFPLLAFQTAAKAQDLDFQLPDSRWALSWLQEFYNRDYVELTDQNLDWSSEPMLIATADIDGQPGNNAIFVAWRDRMFCGASNCSFHVWYWDWEADGGQGNYRQVLDVLYYGDVSLGKPGPGGMKDIWLGNVRWRWNGSQYAP